MFSKLSMKKYKLIERESFNQIDKLPVVYKKLQYDLYNSAESRAVIDSIYVKSSRHQTPLFESNRFYKNIEIFII